LKKVSHIKHFKLTPSDTCQAKAVAQCAETILGCSLRQKFDPNSPTCPRNFGTEKEDYKTLEVTSAAVRI